jgi:hypothetical protein
LARRGDQAVGIYRSKDDPVALRHMTAFKVVRLVKASNESNLRRPQQRVVFHPPTAFIAPLSFHRQVKNRENRILLLDNLECLLAAPCQQK